MAIPRNLSNLAPGADTSGVLGVAKGGTGTSTAFTIGSVVFAGSGGTYTQVWDVRDMTPAEKDAATVQQWDVITLERNFKLQQCDWTQLPDAPLTPEQVTEWRVYRQQLRDVTQQTDPFNIIWTTPPA